MRPTFCMYSVNVMNTPTLFISYRERV